MTRRGHGRTGRFCRKLLQARDGAAAVEFAIVALPFFFMLFAIIEVAVIFILSSLLENGTIETGRLVRTGQASAQGMTATQFQANLCSRMSVFADECATRATVDVRVIPQFNVSPPDPLNGPTFNPSGLTYTNGQPGNLMLVRVWYRHPLLTTFLSQSLSRLDDDTAFLTATTAFRNEPAGAGQPAPAPAPAPTP
ncbi:MAG: TadE/TadG family type IV pilus assembly protein [Brevundimonas sp.]|uniref:TadE/TadG family type IV pilus assembly protein n=1 Tax=Brevundimonas sp. TaxID=1871086 RepID=UPI00391982AF